MKSKRRQLNSMTKPTKEPKLSRNYAPADLSPVDWQRGLRRQFGREQAFGLENLGSEPFFSEFRVSNPVSKSSYRVAIRGPGPGGNFCSCPDYTTSELGTCKHLEFTLAQLEKKRGAKTAFARGYQPAFSELYLRNEGTRRVHFRAGSECPPAVREEALGLFDAGQDGMLRDDRFAELEPFIAMVSKSGHEFRAYDDALEFIAGLRDADRRASKLAELFPRGARIKSTLAWTRPSNKLSNVVIIGQTLNSEAGKVLVEFANTIKDGEVANLSNCFPDVLVVKGHLRHQHPLPNA